MSLVDRALGPRRLRVALCALVGASAACGGRSSLRVSPSEIPAIEAALVERPDDQKLVLRYAAALFADGNCAAARVQAEAAAALDPANGVTPLIQGQCLEAEGRLAEAVDVYAGYLRGHADAAGSDAVRGRRLLAQRALAEVTAREAIARESELSALPADPAVVAVLPAAILGDDPPRYAALSGALAQMLVSDLSLIERIRLVERTQLASLMDELALSGTDRVDPATALRLGRLVRAERLVQPAAIFEQGSVRLEAGLIESGGSRVGVDLADGDFRDILSIEKQLALDLATRLVGPLTEAEERRILDNGPQSIEAFLHWADGLILEEVGDFAAAAAAYDAAAGSDPGFTEARTRARLTASAATVIGRSPADVVASGQVAARAVAGVSSPGVGGALAGAVYDLAALGPEASMGATPGVGSIRTPGFDQLAPPLPLDVILRILVRIPR